MKHIIIIILFIILFNNNFIYSKRYSYGDKIPLNQDINYYFNQNFNQNYNHNTYQNQLFKLKNQLLNINSIKPSQQSKVQNDKSIKLYNSYPVSENCTNIFLETMMQNPTMVMFSGVGYNELGNYDSCIQLASNKSQYCLFDGTIESILPVLIGVCYPSSNYCSNDDILGLMTQYTVLSLELMMDSNITLNATTMIKCYNQDNPSFTQATKNIGTWIMTGISSFILLQVLVGTLVDYLFIYKLVSLRKRYSGSNNPYSLLNPNSYFEPNYNNINSITNSDSGDNNNGDDGEDNQIGKRIQEIEPPFYFSILNQFEITSDQVWVKYLLCFSLIRNFNSLVYSSSSKRYFDSLDGIRTLSTCWVILGHSLLFGVMGLGYDNLLYIVEYAFKPFSFQAIPAGEFAVDTFFMLSGFLVVYSVLTQLNKFNSIQLLSTKQTRINSKYGTIKFWLIYLIHRFIRLSPLYYFLLFFSMYILPLIGSGPAWYMYYGFSYSTCKSNWWVNLLYINNLYSTLSNECYAWAWYLANDMQFFLVTPLIIILFRKSKALAWLLVVGLICGCIINTTIISYKYHLTPFFDMISASSDMQTNQFITDIYQKPWNRVGPYLVGILVAFIYCDPNTSKRVKFIYHKRWVRYFIYLVALFITFFLSYIPYSFYKNQWSNYQNSLFSGFAHTWFTIGLALFIIATFYGYGGILKWFLELGIWKFFSKLTYSAYLVHPLVIMYRIYSMTNLLHYSLSEFTYMYIGNISMTFAFSFIIHLFIEKPFINIERLIFSN